MSDIFERLLALSTSRVPRPEFRGELIPIEETVDGWYCLERTGAVVHVTSDGDAEQIAEARTAAALVGKLATVLPLATYFLGRYRNAEVCATCNGSGVIDTLPLELQDTIACECGGIGWRPKA